MTKKKLVCKILTIKQKISTAHEKHNSTPPCWWGELLTPRSISLTIWAHVPKFKILDNGNIIHERTKISTYRGIRRPIQIISSISIFGFSTVYSKENLKLENICDNIFLDDNYQRTVFVIMILNAFTLSYLNLKWLGRVGWTNKRSRLQRRWC